MDTGKELTICPVYYSSLSKKFVELNAALTQKLNAGNNWIWLVGDNTPPGFADKLDERKFTVVRGFDQTNPRELGEYYKEGGSPKHKIYSYWHGATLNKMIKLVRTRFLLILDNNFFIVRNGWINDALTHMKKNGLGFFGVPNVPAAFAKYRYFPEVHCFFIDLEKVGARDLNFMPYLEDVANAALRRRLKRTRYALASFSPAWISKAFDMLLVDRLRVGTSRDVGYRIFHKFKKSGIKSECAEAVIKPAPGFLRRALELPFPDKLSLLPKRSGYYAAHKSFLGKERAYWEDRNFEEFWWQGAPFGFHIRGRAYGGRGQDELEKLFKFIESELNRFV